MHPRLFSLRRVESCPARYLEKFQRTERLRPSSSCPIRRAPCGACRNSFCKVPSSLFSFAVTGDPSVSASWRITVSTTAKFARQVRASRQSRLTRPGNPKRCARSCTCHFRSCVIRSGASCSNGTFTTRKKRAASLGRPFSSSIATAGCAIIRSIPPPCAFPRQKLGAFFKQRKKRGRLAANYTSRVSLTSSVRFATLRVSAFARLTRRFTAWSSARPQEPSSSRPSACPTRPHILL